MTPWEVKQACEFVAASDLHVTTVTESYTGTWKRPTRYPRPAATFIAKEGYGCLIRSSTPSTPE